MEVQEIVTSQCSVMLGIHCHFSRVASPILWRGIDFVEFEDTKGPFQTQFNFRVFSGMI